MSAGVGTPTGQPQNDRARGPTRAERSPAALDHRLYAGLVQHVKSLARLVLVVVVVRPNPPARPPARGGLKSENRVDRHYNRRAPRRHPRHALLPVRCQLSNPVSAVSNL
eukprot:scaffold5460_cov97-Isochrysis_galbana.AAC.2